MEEFDEIEVLPDGCCFLQVPRAGSGADKYEVIKGNVMVTKHPVMHPVRRLGVAYVFNYHTDLTPISSYTG